MDTHSASQPQTILAPAQPEGTTAILRTWLKHTGDPVVKDEPVAELETDKVVVEVFAPCDGALEIIAAENSPILPDTVLGRVTNMTQNMRNVQATTQSTTQPTAPPTDAGQVRDPHLSPAVRRLVAQHALDPAQIQGTGRGGRLTREDVVKAIDALAQENTETSNNSTQVPHSPMRRRIAQHMQQSLATAPHVTAVFEADFSAILRHRQTHKTDFAQQGVHLTLTSYFVSAAAAAMRTVPGVNSRWHGDYLEVFQDINIGVGTALGEQGLIVPVIQNTQSLSLLGIAARLQTLTETARRGALTPQDVQHGTFTISNYGVSGALVAAPIILNQGQAAILGIGAIQKRVVVVNVQGVDSIQIRPMAYVSLTIDHRVLNGDQANAWLTRFVQTIERWES